MNNINWYVLFLCKIEFRVLNKIKRIARFIAASIENGAKMEKRHFK